MLLSRGPPGPSQHLAWTPTIPQCEARNNTAQCSLVGQQDVASHQHAGRGCLAARAAAGPGHRCDAQASQDADWRQACVGPSQALQAAAHPPTCVQWRRRRRLWRLESCSSWTSRHVTFILGQYTVPRCLCDWVLTLHPCLCTGAGGPHAVLRAPAAILFCLASARARSSSRLTSR